VQRPHHKLLAGFQALYQHIQLVRQLPTLCTALVCLACNARHYVRGEIRDFDRREDIAQFGDEIGFDGFDGNVVDEAFEGNLTRGKLS
jgi:hypothetical protein